MSAEGLTELITNHLKEYGISSVTAFLLAAIIAILLFKQVSKKKYRLPPGPIGLPFFGYAPFLGREPHVAFYKVSKKYGNLISCYLGRKLVIVANDFTSVKEVLGRDEFLNRPEEPFFATFFKDRAVITENGQVWKEQRRFTLHQLRDLGFGKTRLEEHIQEEISCFVKELVKYGGQLPNLRRVLSISTANNIRFLVFGQRTDYDDPRSNKFEECNEKAQANFEKAFFEMLLPSWVGKVLQCIGIELASEKAKKELLMVRSLVKEEIEEHKKTFREDNIRDLVDGFLLEMKKRQNEESSFNDDFLLGNALIFFNAGSDTTKATLCWLFLLMATHEDVQQRAYQEIIEVIGKERMPNWSDHTKLPYCKSAIAESQRIKPIVPLNLERGPSGDTTIFGYDVPKHVIIFTNIWAVHHDPTYWKNPEKFDPARFLSEDGKKYIKSERLIPFSAGRRSCPGETMANVEIFLYFVSILQHFQLCLKDGQKIDVDEIIHAFVPFALMERIEFKLRNE